jgi:hypothetical protein
MHAKLCLVLLSLFALAGCSGLSGKATRALTASELDYLNRLRSRVAENGPKLDETLATMTSLTARHVAREHTLALSISKAKLLESMKSPWAPAAQQGQLETQRSVALYHLYDLAEAERAVIDARVAERRAATKAVADSYGQLRILIDRAIENEKVLLAYLDRPQSTRIAGVATTFLAEVQAFNRQLALSEHPELRKLATSLVAAEERVSKARERIDAALKLVR